MLKKLMKKEEGFTLAELLIVVAIIAVLVAVSIPIFTGQLKKSRLATNQANARAAKAAAVTEYLSMSDPSSFKSGNYDVTSGIFTAGTAKGSVTKTTQPNTWTVESDANLTTGTYNNVGVTLGSDGEVTQYSFGS